MMTEDTISNLLPGKYCLNIEYYVTLEFKHIHRKKQDVWLFILYIIIKYLISTHLE